MIRHLIKRAGLPDCVWVGMLACLPALLAWAVFGVIRTPDTPGYVEYAAQIVAGGVPAGTALLRSAPAPVSLFRAPGLPLLLAGLRIVAPGAWPGALVAIQIAAGAALAVLTHAAARRMGMRRGLAMAVALMPCVGFAVVVQLCVLTDALYASLAAGAALLLLWPGVRPALAAGAMLAAATALREATPFLALCYLPLALAGPARTRRGLLVVLPAIAAALALAAWNEARIGQPVLTTSRQTVMIQAVLPLLARGLPVYPGDDLFDRTARATVGGGDYGQIDALHRRLFASGMDAVAMSAAADARYWRAWRRFPAAMTVTVLARLRPEFLTMGFQPLDTVGALLVYAGWPRPTFDRLDVLWQARRGHAAAWATMTVTVTLRLCGLAVFLLALAAPLRATGDPRRWGLACVCAGFFAIYLPVHIETRYLVPIVPLTCLLAGCALTPREDAARRCQTLP